MDAIFRAYRRLLADVDCSRLRYLYHSIDWNDRLIGIKGARGVGKTTMMLQRIKLNFPKTETAVYASLDQLWFSDHTIIDFVEFQYAHGVTHVFLDEVHRYKNWARELKNIYDSYPGLHIVFTGSSLLEIDASVADLSRRCMMYEMRGLSFREYLSFENAGDFPALSLADIFQNHVEISSALVPKLKILPYFEAYLRHGYYPFYRETNQNGYYVRLERAVSTVIDYDIPAATAIEFATLSKMKRLLVILAENVPFTLNVSTVCTSLATTRNQLLQLLVLLERSAIIRRIFSYSRGMKQLVKPDKILFDNPNIIEAIGRKSDIGTIRESFAASMLSYHHQLDMPKEGGDLLVDGHYLIEVGGSGKSFAQIRNIPDSYVAADGIEYGIGNRIPLYLFGFLY